MGQTAGPGGSPAALNSIGRWTASRAKRVLVGAIVLALTAGVACGGGDDTETSANAPPSSGPTSTSTVVVHSVPTVPRTTVAPPEGVEEYAVTGTHVPSGTAVTYAQVPPVGGPHPAGSWETCTFYDRPLFNETAVHSLEHGAIWITYRPDLPPEELQILRDLVKRRLNVLVSRWDEGLPAPVVVSSWGRQMKLETASDPRVEQYIAAFSGKSPEPNGPC